MPPQKPRAGTTIPARATSTLSGVTQLNTAESQLKTINWLNFSHPGVGKTVLAGTGGPTTLIMDSDHGAESAEAQGSKAHRKSVITYDEVEEVYQHLKTTLAKGTCEYKLVWWDGLTLFQNRVLIDEIMRDVVAQNPRQEEFVPSMREYLINMNTLARYVRQFCELDINFGMSAHVISDTDPDGKIVYVPAIQGKDMPALIAGYANVVSYMSLVDDPNNKGKKIRRCLFVQEGKYTAKDRFHALGHHVDNPTVPTIIGKIDKARAERRAGNKTATAATAVRRPVSKSTTPTRRKLNG
jgi:hypothetical protein